MATNTTPIFAITPFVSIAQIVSGTNGNLPTVWAWGDNTNGVLGTNNIVARSSPVSVVGNHSFIALAGGFTNIAMKTNGDVWTWGSPTFGQIGDNATAGRSSPVSVVGAHSFALIASCGFHLAGVKQDGTVWAWGYNAFGQLGNNSATNRSSPTSVVGNHTFVKLCGEDFTVGLKADGTAWTWGNNANGQLGDNTTSLRSSPVSVAGAHSFTTAASGSGFSIALKADGTAWAWGFQHKGQLGDNTGTTQRISPVSIVGAHSFIGVACGNEHTIAVKADGSCWAWGSDTGTGGSGALGQGIVIADRSSPVSVVGAHSFIKIGTTQYVSHGLKTDGSVWSWGGNVSGGVGDNTTTNRSSPVSTVGAVFGTFLTTNSQGSSQAILAMGLQSGLKRIFVAPTNGSWIDNIVVQATSHTSSGVVRIYIRVAGGDLELFKEVTVSAITVSTSTVAFSDVVPVGLSIPFGTEIWAASQVEDDFNIIISGGNY